MSYQSDRAWSDAFIPAIRSIVAPLLFDVAPDVEDMERGTDLMVFKARDMRVAARVRRSGYSEKYPDDFTIRAKRDSGAKTELAKLIDGYADWMFYGHQSEGANIGRWFVIDLHKWRGALLRSGYNGSWCSLAQKRSNGDGTHFYVFNVKDFPDAVVASS